MKSNNGNLLDETKLNEFMLKVLGDISISLSAMLVIIGERLGLYRTMSKSRPITSIELAKRTNTTEQYVREWLANEAAGGYILYNTNYQKFFLPPEVIIFNSSL